MLNLNVPEGWTVEKLKEAGESIIGLTYSPGDVVDSQGIEVLRSSNIFEGRIVLEDLVRVSSSIPQKIILRRGDILICARNGSQRLIGKNARIDELNSGKTFGAFMCVYRSKNPDYMFWVFQTELFRKQIARDLGPTINQVTTGNLNLFKFAFPHEKEQQQITAVLETWEEYLVKLDKKIELKTNIRKGLQQRLLTSTTTDRATSRLNKIGVFMKGAGIPKDSLVADGLPAVRYGELYTKHNVKVSRIYSRITPETARTATAIQKGDILFAGSGETIEDIGKSAAYMPSDIAYAGGDIVIFRANKNSDSLFLAYLLNSATVRRELRRLGQGQSVVHVYKRDLEHLKLTLPAKAEQSRIAQIINSADEEIEDLLLKRDHIKQQRKYLVNNLITGEIRIPKNLVVQMKEASHA